MEKNQKKDTKLICLIVFLIICVIGLSGYIVYDKVIDKDSQKNSANNTTEDKTPTSDDDTDDDDDTITDEKIISNFYKTIEEVKQGKQNSALLCNLNHPQRVDCTKIKEFNIAKIEKVDEKDGAGIYKFEISLSCKDGSSTCFYNEQYDRVGDKLYTTTYYKVENGIVTESLGNSYNALVDDGNNTNVTPTTPDRGTTNGAITDEQVISNFYKTIEEVKQGKANSALLCNVDYPQRVDCTKIKEFNVKNIKKVKDLDGASVYEFSISWSCKDNNTCFYNPQVDVEGDKYVVTTYYKVVNGVVTESLGNFI